MHPLEGSAKEGRELRKLPRTHPGHGQKGLPHRDLWAAGTDLLGAAEQAGCSHSDALGLATVGFPGNRLPF